MSAEIIEMTPHMLQHAGVVSDGDQYGHSTAVAPVASMFAGLTRQERELAVTGLVQTASGMLRQAIDAGEPADVMSGYKDQAAALADLTKRLDVSKDAVLDAQVLQRQAERGLGLAIRAGQADGTVAKPGDIGGNRTLTRTCEEQVLQKPADFASEAELAATRNGIYALADNGTDEDFEDAVTEAREEGNVSRANVVRKLKSRSEAQEAEAEKMRAESDEWHQRLAGQYLTTKLAFEAEGHQRHASLDAFQTAARNRGVKYRMTEPQYAKHVATSQDRLFRAALSLETAIGVFEHIDLETITKEQAEDALQRIDTRAFNLIIRSLKEISNER